MLFVIQQAGKLRMNAEFEGSCICGCVRFSVNGFSEKVANYHCSMCRKSHGAVLGTIGLF